MLDSSYVKPSNIFKILGELWPYFWNNNRKLKHRLIFSVICNFLAIGRFVVIPVLFSNIVDTYSFFHFGNIKTSWFLTLLVGYVLVWWLGKIFLCTRELLMLPVMERAVRALSSSLYQHIQLLPFQYHLKRKVGEITSAIETSIVAFPLIVWAIVFILGPLLIESLCVIGIVGYICGGSYALILGVSLLLFVITTRFGFIKTIRPLRDANSVHIWVMSKIVDSLLSFASIKYFHAYKYEFEKIDRELEVRESKIIDSLVKDHMVPIYQTFILSGSFLFLMLFTGYNLILGKISLGEFIMIHSYVLQFTLPLERLGQVFQTLNQNLVKMERAFLVFKESFEDKRGSVLLDSHESLHIVFEDVWFGYQKEAPLLKGVSFDLSPGKSLAIIGETGSGKSTILNLLLGFLKPWKGRVMVNGYDVRDIEQKSLINLIGIVPQEVTLFHDSISHNILYANFLADEKMLLDTINLSSLEKTIKKLPEGLQTIVGERGSKLSGGERQRIGLARAIIRHPKMYIFDEATSSLDSKTENQILKNIKTISNNVSTLIISHKLSAISFADRILRLDDGVLEEVKHDFFNEVNE